MFLRVCFSRVFPNLTSCYLMKDQKSNSHFLSLGSKLQNNPQSCLAVELPCLSLPLVCQVLQPVCHTRALQLWTAVYLPTSSPCTAVDESVELYLPPCATGDELTSRSLDRYVHNSLFIVSCKSIYASFNVLRLPVPQAGVLLHYDHRLQLILLCFFYVVINQN